MVLPGVDEIAASVCSIDFAEQTVVMKILVVGATGMLGAPVARQLRADGHDVRVFARDAGRARQLLGDGFEIRTGDVGDSASLLAAMQQCEAVHVNLRGGNTLASYARIERDGAANIAAAAARCGVARLGYVSAAGIGDRPARHPLFELKAAAVAAVAGSGVGYTIFKPTHFMESLPQFVQRGRATIIGNQPHRYHYLAAADFAVFVSHSYRMDSAANQSIAMLGPEPWTMAEALTQYCAAVHPGMAIGQMPVVIARMLGLLTGNRDLQFAATLFAAFSLAGEWGDDALARRLFGPPRTTLREWCRLRAGDAQQVVSKEET